MRKTILTMALLGLVGVSAAGDRSNADFDRLDADHDGWLTAAEYAAAKSDQSFESLDHNSDGKLDTVEFAAAKTADGGMKKK
jgi:hypothetical protein